MFSVYSVPTLEWNVALSLRNESEDIFTWQHILQCSPFTEGALSSASAATLLPATLHTFQLSE